MLPTQKAYVHVIYLTPMFAVPDCDLNTAAMFNVYNSNLCYGLVTAKPLPRICSFPVYVSAGEIRVDFGVNENVVRLSEEQIGRLRRFHVFVFSEVLRILPSFLMLDDGPDAQMMLLVPLRRDSVEIAFDVVEGHERMEAVEEPSRNVKAGLVVTEEEYLGKIVTPWYRTQETVCKVVVETEIKREFCLVKETIYCQTNSINK